MKTREQKIEAFTRITSQITKEFFVEHGHPFNPMLHVLYTTDDQEEYTQTEIIELPPNIMELGSTKDQLVEMIIPALVEAHEKVNRKVICIALASDAFVSSKMVLAEDMDKMKQLSNAELVALHRQSEKKTALILIYYTRTTQFSECFLYKTEGDKVTITGQVSIASIDNRSRFANLLKPNPRDN